jgi:hypothetical protein
MLVRYSEANDIPVVIGCDANSHHVAWAVLIRIVEVQLYWNILLILTWRF